jgi:glycosyltransferase involved in cell wall biosynthesis
MGKYRIFDYCWHIPHQYDLIHALKNDCDFYYCPATKKSWDTRVRPLPEAIRFVTAYEPGNYDFAILHVDQESIVPNHEKRRIYVEFDNIIHDIPKIVINHGSPVFPEHFLTLNGDLSYRQMEETCIREIRTLIGSNTMVVNSHSAASPAEWGFGIPIVHGMDPEEWLDLPKEPRVFTALSSVGMDSYYNRACMIRTSELLYDKYRYRLGYARLNVDTGHSIEEYRNYLGRSLLYLDTSFRTPMNRARTEAFLSGCCVIQVEGAHDLDRWARPGENMILTPDDPQRISDLIADLLGNRYEEAIRIGQNGKKMAIREFNRERYRQDWLTLFDTISHE